MPRKKRAGASTWVDDGDAPELTDTYFERSDVYEGARLVRRGRPTAEHPKEQVTLRLDPDVLAYFRAGGSRWQSRINAALRKAARLPAKA